MSFTVYPAIDLRGGRCVRLIQGRADAETVYYTDPLEPARQFRDAGASWLHVVDLDGAFEGRSRNLHLIEQLAGLGLQIQLGGGLREEADLRAARDAGAARVIVGTRAAAQPELVATWAQLLGEALVVGIDARDGKVAVKGWVETLPQDAMDLALQLANAGVRRFVYTDISRDGVLSGPNLPAQEAFAAAVAPAGAAVIASGGVASAGDVVRLRELHGRLPNLEGVIVGKALYEGRVTVAELLQAAE